MRLYTLKYTHLYCYVNFIKPFLCEESFQEKPWNDLAYESLARLIFVEQLDNFLNNPLFRFL